MTQKKWLKIFLVATIIGVVLLDALLVLGEASEMLDDPGEDL